VRGRVGEDASVPRTRPAVALLAALAAMLVAAGCTLVPSAPPWSPPPADVPVGSSTGSTAAAALAALPVKGRAPKSGYERDRFGQRWADIDRNGCDQRNDVLARDLAAATFEPGTRDCVVRSGVLTDPYTGTTVTFVRGQDTSDDVPIDHVVALSDAWQKGAQQLTAAQRERLANDPLNLQATTQAANSAKGDADAATWLPPARAYRCTFVARQVAVKATYGLWVTPAERDAMARVLDRCPDTPLPGRQGEDEPMPLIAIVRHAQASFGAADYDQLSAVGREQAEVVGAELARRQLRDPAVVTGRLQRQQDTAGLLAAAAGIGQSSQVDGRWDEYDHFALLRRYVDPERVELATGDSRTFQGLLDEALTAWSDDAEDAGWAAFAGNAAAALDDLAAGLQKGTDAIVVTSGGVLAALAAGLLHAPAATAIALNRVAVNCAITTVIVGSKGPTLLSFNDHGHFTGGRRSLLTYR
jgi:broad specificity phosphatase PhoE